jgi:hypothetical protein
MGVPPALMGVLVDEDTGPPAIAATMVDLSA